MVVIILAITAILTANYYTSFRYIAIKNVPKAVNDLGKMIGQQQRNEVTPAVLNLGYHDQFRGITPTFPGYSHVDQTKFERSGKLTKIIKTVKVSKVFLDGVAAIRKLPAETQDKILEKYARPIDPPWTTTLRTNKDAIDVGYKMETRIAKTLTNIVKESL
jgi:hypothetical protein